MNIDQLTELFKWLTIINVAFFLVGSVLTMLMRKVGCKIHGKMFGITEENVSIILYGWLGLYKIMILVFNIVPYVAFCIIGQ